MPRWFGRRSERRRPGRRRPPPRPRGPRDPVFGYFGVEQAARFRSLVRSTFAEAGVEVVVHPDHVVADDGHQYGLYNLAAACLDALSDGGEQAWPALVQRHVRTILRAVSEEVALGDLSRDDVLNRVYLRVLGRAAVPPEALARHRYARPLADDLLEVLALDSPDTVRVLRDEDVEAFGLSDLRAAGLENLLKEPIAEHEVLTGGSGARLDVVHGPSVFTASKLLVLPDVLGRTQGTRQFPNGVFVAVPFWHQLAFVPIRDLSVVGSLQALVGFAAHGFDEGVGAISPFVYWWRDGELTQVSFPAADRGLEIRPSDELIEVLNGLPPPTA